MTPKPSSPHANEILQSFWEDSLDPAELVRRALQLGKLSAELLAKSEDGQVGALQLLNYGQGALAESISGAWTRYFFQMGLTSAAVGQASTDLIVAATVLGNMLLQMSGVVTQAESVISNLEAARPILEFHGLDVDSLIRGVVTEAQGQIVSLSAAAAAGVPQNPIMSMPPPGMSSVSVAPGGIPQAGVNGPPTMPSEFTPVSGQKVTGDPSTATGHALPPTQATGEPAVVQTPSPVPTQALTGAPAGPGLNPSSLGGVSSPNVGSAPPGMPSSPMSPSTLSAPSTTPSLSAPVQPGSNMASVSPTALGAPAAAPGQPVSGMPAPTSTMVTPLSGVAANVGTSAVSGGAVLGGGAPAMSVAAAGSAVPAAPAVAASAGVPASPVASTTATPVSSSVAAATRIFAPTMGSSLIAPPVTVSPVAPAQAGTHLVPAGGPAGVTTPAGTDHASLRPPTHGHGPADSSDSDKHRDDQPALAPIVAGLDGAVIPGVVLAAVGNPLALPVDEYVSTARRIIAAIGGGGDVGWAAAVMDVDGTHRLALTSDRGRGWLPADAVVPDGILNPWEHRDSARWEGLADPVRVLLEYAAATGARIEAVASTRAGGGAGTSSVSSIVVDASLRARPELLDMATTDRVRLQVAERQQQAVNAITDPIQQRVQALWLACDADARAPKSAVRTQVLTACQQNLARIHQPRWLAGLPWDRLADEHHDLCVRERGARLDARDIAVGALDTGGGPCRKLLAQAYANEATLALRDLDPAAALLSAVYCWSMLLDIC